MKDDFLVFSFSYSSSWLCFECAYFDWTASSDAVCPWDLPLAPWFRGVIFSHTGAVTVLLHLFGLPIFTRLQSLGAKAEHAIFRMIPAVRASLPVPVLVGSV